RPVLPSILDPAAALAELLRAHLAQTAASATIRVLSEVSPRVRWRPHVVDAEDHRGWHCLSERLDDADDGWMARMQRATVADPSLKLGLCASVGVLRDAAIIEFADRTGAALCAVTLDDTGQFTSLVAYA